ncbi:MAG: ribosome biogenesis GTPase Der, partial [Bacilli bacterium]|nr:ribosome biogenesis GTPase Der [Bacilli bacterium]
DDYISISSEHGDNTNNLLELIISNFDNIKDIEYDSSILKFCVIGRPNVGKSSLVNAILNEDRLIVSNTPNTTRDSVDTPFKYDEKEFVAIDTAGIRKSGKVYENIERYSALRSLKAIDRSDVCLLVLNVEEGIIEQDKHIVGYALESGKAVVIVVNKWDKTEKTMKEFEKEIRNNFAFMPYAQIVFLSALTKKRLHTLMPEVLRAYENWNKEIQTSPLNNVIHDAVSLNQPPSYKSKRLKIYYVNQIGTQPPKFLFQVNDKNLIHFSYERYLENKIRESFDLIGTPIILVFKNRGEK